MKETTDKIVRALLTIAVLSPFIALVVFVSHKTVEHNEKLKELEIERKLELVDWSNLRFDFTYECEKSLNKIDGLQAFLSTKSEFTNEEVKELGLTKDANTSLSVEYVCDELGGGDALSKSFSNEFSSVERKYDPSSYDDADTTERMWRILK